MKRGVSQGFYYREGYLQIYRHTYLNGLEHGESSESMSTCVYMYMFIHTPIFTGIHIDGYVHLRDTHMKSKLLFSSPGGGLSSGKVRAFSSKTLAASLRHH